MSVLFAFYLFAFCLTGSVSSQEKTNIRFTDQTSKTGIGFIHHDGSSGKHYLVETMSAGLASFDYDSDGDPDLYFVNGAALRDTTYEVAPTDQLYRNEGEFSFTDVSQLSGLNDMSFGMGVTVGDYDNDGFPDVYVSNFGPNSLYHNNGDGTFQKIESSVLGRGDLIGGGCCMLDFDADGLLDIYATNYATDLYGIKVPIFRDRLVYGGPLLYPKASDNLLRNLGDGTFLDVSQATGIASEAEWEWARFVSTLIKMATPISLWPMTQLETFFGRTMVKGNSLMLRLSMGSRLIIVATPKAIWAWTRPDFDGDHFLDLHVTTYAKQFTLLFRHDQQGFFDSTRQAGTGVNTFYQVNWGTCFADFDNDGDKDIFNANGHTHDNLDDLDDTVTYKTLNQVLENRWPKKFVDVSTICGDGLQILESSRGLVADDMDLDGRIDVVILNHRTKPSILRNESIKPGNWICLDLVSILGNRNAVGSRVIVYAKGKSQVLEVTVAEVTKVILGQDFILAWQMQQRSTKLRYIGTQARWRALRTLTSTQLI